MPREFIVATRRMPETDDLRAAAGACGLSGVTIARVRDGVLDLILSADGQVVLSVQYTKLVDVPDEVERLAPAVAVALPGPVFWTEAWARVDGADPGGVLAERVAAALAVRCDGVCMREDGALV